MATPVTPPAPPVFSEKILFRLTTADAHALKTLAAVRGERLSVVLRELVREAHRKLVAETPSVPEPKPAPAKTKPAAKRRRRAA